MPDLIPLNPGRVGATPEPWMSDALCAETDGDLFFPDSPQYPFAAKRICDGCDVRTQCLQFALDNQIDDGVFGGTTPNDRKAIRRTA